MRPSHHLPIQDNHADSALLDLLTAPVRPTSNTFARRDDALDPLLIAAAAASGPHVTRNHYHHDFFPGVMLPKAEGSWDWSKWTPGDTSNRPERKKFAYVSRQAPRRQRLVQEGEKENDCLRDTDPLKTADNLPPLTPKKRRSSITAHPNPATSDGKLRLKSIAVSDSPSLISPVSPIEVKCMARTRIPTPHGPAFLHLYHNNRDTKEHLAIVIDPAQLSDNPGIISVPSIRSLSLDAVWDPKETDMDRITRGAYIGRLSPTSQQAYGPPCQQPPDALVDAPPPLIRIHSECFTGETIGSMRCDCGEQLDEAIRQISNPITIPTSPNPTVIPGRGAVIYLRQEGRGIGLLSKIRAYNLQDLGHDTVTANLMLGHKADERGYEIAGAILRDLGLGSGNCSTQGVRLLTNNPDKVEALKNEGIKVVERVPMIPRSWQKRHEKPDVQKSAGLLIPAEVTEFQSLVGATLLGGKEVYGEDLDKYLRTKIMRMGHLLPLWMEEQA